MERWQAQGRLLIESTRRQINRQFPLQVVAKYAQPVSSKERRQHAFQDWTGQMLQAVKEGEIEKTATAIRESGLRRRAARARMREVLNTESRLLKFGLGSQMYKASTPIPHFDDVKEGLQELLGADEEKMEGLREVFPEPQGDPLEAMMQGRGDGAMELIATFMDYRRDLEKLQRKTPLVRFLDRAL